MRQEAITPGWNWILGSHTANRTQQKRYLTDKFSSALKEKIFLYKRLPHKGLFKVSSFQEALKKSQEALKLYLSNLYDI